ncbi:hypothetical protein [Clostridium tagluense]|uniref:hypothetical protein n=1 Tax=Clostridium tagluense TaxID=360422 RepID=UPI001C0E1539|nr:hypothetical protein [Clostridium tagluense]MBU3130558.1 hypothetical protein [Clostridium tagluense]
MESKNKECEDVNQTKLKKIDNLSTSLATVSIELVDLIHPIIKINFTELFSRKRREERKKQEQIRKIELLNSLANNGVDIGVYERHLNNEINRRMKTRYGAIFLLLTFLFTVLSYLIIILNSKLKWGIDSVAITALVIEVPIQFVGILYIIARNLFPERKEVENK